MSFAMLKAEVIDAGLCQGCGLCAGCCKHLKMEKLRPAIKDYCILERDGLDCGLCYNNCPQVQQIKFQPKDPQRVYSLRSTDPEILARAARGGFVTSFAKYLLENQQIAEIIMVQNQDGVLKADAVTDPNDVVSHSGVAYGRSGILAKLNEGLGKHPRTKLGVIGVPCEIRGAAELEENSKANILKIGLFCNASVRTEKTDQGQVCSPCCSGCPAGVNAQGYVALIRQGKYEEALSLIREQNPLPSICGRICTHECEYACTLIGTDHPVAVRELKKFVTEWEMAHADELTPKKPKKGAKKVAIIGSGPAGLTAAYYLAKLGYAPTVFEKENQVGGMLRFGVPQFRLPESVLDYDIAFIERNGVEVKLNTPLGPELTFDDLKAVGYEAIFLSIGQYKPKSLHLAGEDLPGVHMAINFLIDRKYRYWADEAEFQDKIVGVLGGGPVAVDVAQTALRLGAKKVILTEIRTEAELKIVVDDIPPNELQYIEYLYETGTAEITPGEDGRLVVKCHKVEPAPPYPKIEGTEFDLGVDAYVIAIGQDADYSLLDAAGGEALQKNRNKIIIDEVTFETNLPGIFAGGDIVANSKAVAIAAIAHGREAAVSIDRYLRGEDLHEGRVRPARSFFTAPLKPPKDYSVKPETLANQTESLLWNFEEITGKFDEEMALREARRCLSCNQFCAHCQDFPAIYADITAGEVGSLAGFTTVVAWTQRGQALVDEAIQACIFEEQAPDETALTAAIDAKAERQLTEFKLTPRQQVLAFVNQEGTVPISIISAATHIAPGKVRYEVLRLVQDGKLKMDVDSGSDEPTFAVKTD
ncbi:MAG TPA: FAD-dependent oxidoreductase [Candidatus Lokiarchaeia archaeon]|nr:FAD-dependent oxidoreductase [Candidatus Lokiarchaeia archaeon]